MLRKDGTKAEVNGRPRIDIDKQKEIKRLAGEGKCGYAIAKELKMSLTTVYRYLKQKPLEKPSEPSGAISEPSEAILEQIETKTPEASSKASEGHSGGYTPPAIEKIYMFTSPEDYEPKSEPEGKPIMPDAFGRR